MRIPLVVLMTLLPAAAFAADAPRRLGQAHYATGEVTVERALPPRGVIVEKRAGQKLRVTDGDGMPMSRSFVMSNPPRRVEERVYFRDDEPALRRPFALYGGFYGLDRWGVGREDE
ncbi:hypothetical protein [Chenggangzhangella methanolivorans]|uniref:DUF2782 domain-containing protein n=1 Tax=Chenggangzhangella methanolivorans TaxID=1437009 RepID=A0A9E6RC46_9HYPH|nr:hypothetical protein [Chenggangzhangella methanolivorans]QZO01527.1 hypothetical protein K6K41_08920 [Chenggangzhangella methanolivorans]